MRLNEIQADVGLGEGELIPIEVFALMDIKNLKLELVGQAGADQSLRTHSEIDFKLLEGDSLALDSGSYARLWLRVLPSDQAREITGRLAVISDFGRAELPLHIKVWPVQFHAASRLPLQSYSLSTIMGSQQFLSGEDTVMLPAMLDALEALGCKVSEFSFGFHPLGFFGQGKERTTGLPIFEFLKQHGPLTIDTLPELDFSSMDLVVDQYQKHGMTRVSLRASSSGLGLDWQMLKGFAKKALVEKLKDDEAGWRIQEWYARQLRDYFRKRDLLDLWVKIDDEITPSEIPAWLDAAKRWRAIGFKTYTTNTAYIPRSAKLIRRMNEQSDGWQVAEAFFQDFILRTRGSSTLIAHRGPFDPPRWIKYNNGGAMDTYCNGREYSPFSTKVKLELIEDLVVHVDGKPTAMPGPTPWGNKSQGTAFHQGNYIWVSPHDGKHPSETKMELRYAIREKADGGEPAVTLESTDSVWYYGGGYFNAGYLHTRRSTWKGVHYRLAGRGHFACYGWKPEYRLWWYDKGKPIIFSPSYEGLRDSAEDSAYYRRLQSLGATDEVLQMIVGTDESAALRLVEERTNTIFVNNDIGPKTTFTDYNLAKKRMLKALADY